MSLSTGRRGHRGSHVASLALALAAIAVVSGPVSAATPPMSEYGNTVECRYRTSGNGPAYNWWLRRLVVTPPELYAKQTNQLVGWRFVVNRSIWSDGQGPWKVTYRSPIQKRTATRTTPANFATQDADVVLPNIEDQRDVEYTVTLKLFWYRADGSVASQQTYLMPWMKWMQYGQYYYGDYDDTCWGGYYFGP